MNRVSRRSAAEAAEALLEAGRTEPALNYDVELGLERHQDWLRADAPLPDWAGAGVQIASKSIVGIVIKTIVSTMVVGALATAAWQARDLLQPSAAIGKKSAPGVVATQPAVQDAPLPEAEGALAPIPIPLPEQNGAREHTERRMPIEKRAPKLHRAHKAHADSTLPPSKRTQLTAAPEGAAAKDAPAASTQNVAVVAARMQPERSGVQKPRPEQPPEAKPQQPEDLVEMQEVATAEQLLERAPARALALVQKGDQRFVRGYFQQERAYIAIMALIRLGRIEEARAKAASFAKQFPALPYGARIRTALDAAARVATP